MTTLYRFGYFAAIILLVLGPNMAAGEDGLRRVLPPQQQFGDWRFVTITEGDTPHSIVAFRNARQSTADEVVPEAASARMPSITAQSPGARREFLRSRSSTEARSVQAQPLHPLLCPHFRALN